MLKNDHENISAATDAIGELRKIIVRPDEVGEVLPEALSQSAERDDRLAAATLPIVEENIRQSIKRNPRVLAEAMFPIFGPAIRKAISEALAQMVQSLNQTLERSFSPQGLKWRLEALQTGKPFAEVVILNSLVYRVEQVFLIHRKTGVLLQHVAINDAQAQDADLISAMLTAIQDFVNDSFSPGGEGGEATLETLKVQDFSIWIENSPDAVLAAVIRGTAPLSLREIFLEAIERIQLEQDLDFDQFAGDTSLFDDTKPVLNECLQLQLDEPKETKASLFSPFNLIVAALVLLVLTAGFFWIRSNMRWSDLIARFNREPGFVVTDHSHGFFSSQINGLRDDMAADPREIVRSAGYDDNDIVQQWKPFVDASPEFIERRAAKILAPPTGVTLRLVNGILDADTIPDAGWLADARRLAVAIPGVGGLRIENGALKSAIESVRVKFKCGTTEFEASEEAKMRELAGLLAQATSMREQTSGKSELKIYGAADATGGAEMNAALSRGRAERLKSELLRLEPSLGRFAMTPDADVDGGECSARVTLAGD